MKRFAILTFGLAVLAAATACGQAGGNAGRGRRGAQGDRHEIDRVFRDRANGSSSDRRRMPRCPGRSSTSPLHRRPSTTNAGRARADDAQTDGRSGTRPPRARRTEARPVLSGTAAWNMAAPAGAPAGAGPAARGAAGRSRRAHDGDLVDAPWVSSAPRRPTTRRPGRRRRIRGDVHGRKNKYVGTINAQNQVDARADLDRQPGARRHARRHDVLRLPRFRRRQFPGHIMRTQGGHPVLDLTVSSVKANPAVDATVPENVKAAAVPRRSSSQPRNSPTASST